MSAEIEHLWICFEGEPSPLTIELKEEADLSSLTSYLQSVLQVPPHKIVFLDYNSMKPSRATTIKSLQQDTSAENPLVIRYPLSDNTIFVNVLFHCASKGFSIPHSTGSWQMLLDKCRKTFDRLKENEFFFLTQEPVKATIDEASSFKCLVAATKPGSNGIIVINLVASIKDRKPYDEWGLEEMLSKVLGDKYPELLDIPRLNTDEFGTDTVFTEPELRGLKDYLTLAKSAFNNAIINEATTRKFINPFLVYAVDKVRSTYPSTTLAVEVDFDGTRGYGVLDYVVHCQGLAVLINKAKRCDMQEAVMQNIVQLHTAIEKKHKHEAENPPVVYGIVSTGTEWQFLCMSGSPQSPNLKISRPFLTALEEGMTGVGVVVSIIVRILKTQAKILTHPQTKVEERLAQRRCLESF